MTTTSDAPPQMGPPGGGDRPGFGGPREGGGPGGRPGGGPGGRPRGRGRYIPRRKVCQFCVDKIAYIDYKEPARLRRYVSDRGKIEPRRKTGTCAKHQRALSTALKRARHLALLPFTADHIRETGVFQPRM
jgi:small subunit ribosomal protein S18